MDPTNARRRRLPGVLVALLSTLAGAAAYGADSVDKADHAAALPADPYLWLEDIHGAKPLEWVKEQNARSTAVLQADPDYRRDYDAILKVLDATDRIPYGDLDHQYVFNFWQDAQHRKGIWRRTSIEDYARESPAWDVLLDVDKLAADEHEDWVWKGADCSPSLKRCLVSLSRGGGDAVWCANSIRTGASSSRAASSSRRPSPPSPGSTRTRSSSEPTWVPAR
jgi:prolyl oligopeptidase